jgi:hypothetical protein
MKRNFWKQFFIIESILLILFLSSVYLNNFIPKFFPNDIILLIAWIFLSAFSFFYLKYN